MMYGQIGYRYRERSKENDSVCNLLGRKGPKYLWGKITEKNVSRSQRHKKYFFGGNRVIHSFCVRAL